MSQQSLSYLVGSHLGTLTRTAIVAGLHLAAKASSQWRPEPPEEIEDFDALSRTPAMCRKGIKLDDWYEQNMHPASIEEICIDTLPAPLPPRPALKLGSLDPLI